MIFRMSLMFISNILIEPLNNLFEVLKNWLRLKTRLTISSWSALGNVHDSDNSEPCSAVTRLGDDRRSAKKMNIDLSSKITCSDRRKVYHQWNRSIISEKNRKEWSPSCWHAFVWIQEINLRKWDILSRLGLPLESVKKRWRMKTTNISCLHAILSPSFYSKKRMSLSPRLIKNECN